MRYADAGEDMNELREQPASGVLQARPHTRAQLLCLAGGPVAIVLLAIGLLALAQFLPVPAPGESAAKVDELYRHHPDLIRAGLLVVMFGGTLTGPFVVAIFLQMRRVEGAVAPLAYIQLGMGMLGVLLFVIGPMFLEIAAFRPGRDPRLLLLLNDTGWLFLVGPVPLAILQYVAIGLCALQDRNEEVFPRWLGYFNLVLAVVTTPAALIFFFHSGPLGWDGLFAFWIPLGVTGVWFFAMYVVLAKAVRRQEVANVRG
jgi:hypothetical protein